MSDIIHFDPTSAAAGLPALFGAHCQTVLASLGHTFQDANLPAYFIVCADEATAKWAREQRDIAPRRLPSAALAVVRPQRVTVGLRGSAADHVLLRRFAQWLLDTYECRISDDDGNDLTALGLAALGPEVP